MKKLLLITLLLFAAVACAAEPPAWVAETNGNAQVLLKDMAEFSPASAAGLGVDGYDDRIVVLVATGDKLTTVTVPPATLALTAHSAKTHNDAGLRYLQL